MPDAAFPRHACRAEGLSHVRHFYFAAFPKGEQTAQGHVQEEANSTLHMWQ